ncbi:hypothetical protein FOM02_09920 [Bradyrhizobium sp. SEMIA]|nr:hypothetical protein FOM02_09920 [Bradyrhizobium sp. SEMIA]
MEPDAGSSRLGQRVVCVTGSGTPLASSSWSETTDEVTGMFVTVVAVLCRLGASATGGCVEEIVTDSNMTPEMSMMQCAVGAQAPLAKWMGEHPIYHANWRLERYKCVPGHYEIKGHA